MSHADTWQEWRLQYTLKVTWVPTVFWIGVMNGPKVSHQIDFKMLNLENDKWIYEILILKKLVNPSPLK